MRVHFTFNHPKNCAAHCNLDFKGGKCRGRNAGHPAPPRTDLYIRYYRIRLLPQVFWRRFAQSYDGKCSPAHSDKVKQRHLPVTVYGIASAATYLRVPLGHALSSTGSAEVDISSCSPASSVLCCARLPEGIMNRQYGITPSPVHHSICTLFWCSSFPSKQRHLRCTGDFVEWIPLFQLVYGGNLRDLRPPDSRV